LDWKLIFQCYRGAVPPQAEWLRSNPQNLIRVMPAQGAIQLGIWGWVFGVVPELQTPNSKPQTLSSAFPFHFKKIYVK
jgi:hypothetical protein